MKKLLSLLLAFVMISSTVSFSSFVSLAEDVEEAITEETVETEEAFASEEIITDESDNIEESDLNEVSDIVEEEAIALEEESASSEAPDKESGTVVGDIVTASGKCGDNLTWELDTLGVLTISGTGDMEDFPYDSRLYSYITPWESYWNSIKSVVISEGVTSVSNHAFYDYYTNLTKVTIADTVTYIGSGAFARNDSLTTVVLSGGVTSMGSSVFANNGALSSVTIGEGITVLGDKVFYECPALKSLTFPDSLKTIGDEAFVRSGLTNVKFGSGLTYIGYQAFIASDVTRVDIPSLEAWCNISFDDVFSNPFYYTKKLYVDGQIVKDLVIPDGVTVIKPYAFSYYTTLTSITIPSSVKKISYNAFRSCINVQKLNIAHGVEMIDVYAFYHCTGLTSITVPDSVTYIANSAFYSCKNLESITLPFIGNKLGSETDTERYTFGYIFGTSSFTGSVEIYQYHENGSCRYYVPASLKNVTITGGDISYGAFSNCSMLESITYPDSITDIPPYTFYGCTSLKQINVPNSVTNIGEYAFYQCQNLTSIDVPDSITSIEDYTFAGCAVLSKVEIPNKVTSIGDYAFSECLKLTELNIPVGVTYIGENAFRQCTKFANISLPYGVSYIGSYAFNNTGYYNNSANWTGDVLYIGNHLVATQTTLSGHYDIVPLTRCIAGSAFRECELLTSVSIPNSVVYIGTNAFYLSGVYNNTDNWENGVLYIGDCLIAADSCVSGEYVVIDGTRLIKDKAFSNRSELNYITIPKTVKYIGTDAFIGCTNLTVRCSEGSAAEKYALANSIPVSYLHTECVFTSYISNNNGNCYEDGTMTALCDLGCGKTDTVTEPDSKIHDYYLDIARAATCQRDGLGVNICNICRDYYTEIFLASAKVSSTRSIFAAAFFARSS